MVLISDYDTKLVDVSQGLLELYKVYGNLRTVTIIWSRSGRALWTQIGLSSPSEACNGYFFATIKLAHFIMCPDI